MPTSHGRLCDGAAVGALLFLMTVHVQVAPAQSLGDVAQREADRRTQGSAGRVYTNADLGPDEASATSPAPVPVAAVTVSGAAAPDTPAPGEKAQPPKKGGLEPVIVKGREKRDEQYWRALSGTLRGRLAKVNAAVAASGARLTEIDAGPQTPTTIREREVITATLSRLQRDARSHSEELTRFLTRAQRANVLEDWTR